MKHSIALSILLLTLFPGALTFAEEGFPQKDRELLTELKIKIGEN